MLSKLRIKSIVVALFCLSIFSACVIGVSIKQASGKIDHPIGHTVVIDAGHGGIDGGVTGVESKVKESELNLALAKELEAYFLNAGFKVVMTRSNSAGLYGALSPGFKKRDLKKRVEITNESNADLFISLHMNRFSSSSRRGPQVFFKENSDESKRLADFIQNRLNLAAEGVNSQAIFGDYYVLNGSKIPAVLCEVGFLSNSEDDKLLNTKSYRKTMAYAIFTGVIEYYS